MHRQRSRSAEVSGARRTRSAFRVFRSVTRWTSGWLLLWAIVTWLTPAGAALADQKRLAYLVSDLRIPFWAIMKRGVESKAKSLGYQVTAYSAENSARRELEHTLRVLDDKVDGIILSPTNSSAAVTILKLAKRAGVPVVISDIGTEGGDYVSYIASDNREGSYQIGRILADTLRQRGWDSGSVGVISIPQSRENGRARTAGFMEAMDEARIKRAGIRQQVDFSHQETYRFAAEFLAENPDLRALWLQGSDRYQGALEAIANAGRAGEVLLICFDAEPEFLQMIPNGKLVGAAMQQPYLMGEEAVSAMAAHLAGKPVEHERRLPILAVSKENIGQLLPLIRRNVLGVARD